MRAAHHHEQIIIADVPHPPESGELGVSDYRAAGAWRGGEGEGLVFLRSDERLVTRSTDHRPSRPGERGST